MAGYNFEKNKSELDKTQRISSLAKEAKRILDIEQQLGSKDEYLKTFGSEKLGGGKGSVSGGVDETTRPPRHHKPAPEPHKKVKEDTIPVGGLLGYAMGGNAIVSGAQAGDTKPINEISRIVSDLEAERGPAHDNGFNSPPPVPAGPGGGKNNAGPPRQPKKPMPPEKKPPRDYKPRGGRDYRGFILLAVLIGVVVVLGVIVSVLFSTPKKPQEDNPSANNNAVEPSRPEAADLEDYEGIITNLNRERSSLTLEPFGAGSPITLTLNMDTEYLGQSGGPIALSDLSIGYVVTVSASKSTLLASSVAVSPDFWQLSQVSGILYVPEQGELSVDDNESYKITGNSIFLYRNSEIDPSDITQADIMDITGYKDEISMVTITAYHGYIRINSSSSVQNGEISIDGKSPEPALTGSDIPVAEGQHSVVITGNNIERYSADISVAAGEVYEINLSEVPNKTGILTINVNVDGYRLFIDNREASNPSQPQTLNQGDHTVRIEKEGYEPWQSYVTISSPSSQISAELIPVVSGEHAGGGQTGNGSSPEDADISAFTISSSPAGAEIYIDGALMGTSPLNLTLTHGDYNLMVKKEGYYDATSPINVNEKTESFTVQLTAVSE